MLYSRAGIFSEMAQASPTKLSLSRCNYDLYGLGSVYGSRFVNKLTLCLTKVYYKVYCDLFKAAHYTCATFYAMGNGTIKAT